MNLREFKKRMMKSPFSFEEARLVAIGTASATLKLQLHQWKRAGELIPLKRGLYLFADSKVDQTEIAKELYWPCYISLEYALNHYGLLPDIPFGVTLVTTKATRKFNTPLGQFTYQKIPVRAFLGFNPRTLLAEREKALVDYLYLNKHRIVPGAKFWEEMRWQNLDELKFDGAKRYLQYFNSKKLRHLLESLRSYAKVHPSA